MCYSSAELLKMIPPWAIATFDFADGAFRLVSEILVKTMRLAHTNCLYVVTGQAFRHQFGKSYRKTLTASAPFLSAQFK